MMRRAPEPPPFMAGGHVSESRYPKNLLDRKDLPARFASNTTQTISPGRASHMLLQTLSAYPVEVAMGLREHKDWIDWCLIKDDPQDFDTNKTPMVNTVRMYRFTHERLGRVVHGVNYLKLYDIARNRLAAAGLITYRFRYVRKDENGLLEYLIPVWDITPLGEDALRILNAGAFYVLRFRKISDPP